MSDTNVVSTPPELEFEWSEIKSAIGGFLQECTDYQTIAEILNRLLADKLAKCPKVYSSNLNLKWRANEPDCDHVHEAYLVGIKEINK